MSKIEELVAQCVARMRVEGESALEKICQEHPEFAQKIRERIRILKQIGTLRSELGFEPELGSFIPPYSPPPGSNTERRAPRAPGPRIPCPRRSP